MAVIDDPAVARAIDRCLLARSLADRRGPVTRVHPRPCGWCDYPLPELRRLLEGFNAWAGWDERRRRYERLDVQVWAEAARRDPTAAEAEIVAAQDFAQPVTTSEEPEAREPRAPATAPPVDPELEAWT